MAIFRTLIRSHNSRSFLNTCTSSTTTLPSSLLTISHSCFLSPFSECNHFFGPLFLSSPPCKLVQSATPLYLQGEVVFKKVQSFNSNFLQTRIFPTNSTNGLVSRVVDHKDFRNSPDIGGGFYQSFVNLPNMISMSRLVSGPFIGWMILNEWYLSAFVGLAVSGATDWLDGYVARKMGINSVVGSYLDPLADKFLIGCVALAMVKRDLLHSWLVGLVVLRDLGLISGAFYQRGNSLDWKWKSWTEFTNLDGTHPHRVEPLFLSKVNTVFQLVLVAAALLQPEFGTDETQVYINYMSWLVASTTVASTVAYGAQYLQNGSRLDSKCNALRSKSR